MSKEDKEEEGTEENLTASDSEVREKSMNLVQSIVEALPNGMNPVQTLQIVDNSRRVFITTATMLSNLIRNKAKELGLIENEDNETLH